MKKFVLAVLLSFSTRLDAQTFTLEEVLSAPFPADLVSAPGAGAFAWTQNEQGRRSVWVADAPSYRAKALFRNERDEGQEITQVRFGPTHVVFVRGGRANRAGEIPHPRSSYSPTTSTTSCFTRTGSPP